MRDKPPVIPSELLLTHNKIEFKKFRNNSKNTFPFQIIFLKSIYYGIFSFFVPSLKNAFSKNLSLRASNLFLLIIIFGVHYSFAKPNVDSILAISNNLKTHIEKSDFLFNQAKKELRGFPKTAKILIDEHSKLINNNEAIKQKNYYLKAIYHSRVHKVDSSLFYFNHLTGYQLNNELLIEAGKLFIDLGNLLRRTGKFDSALYYYKSSKLEYAKTNDHVGLSKAYNNTGIVYRKLGELDSAMNYYELSLKSINKSDLKIENNLNIKATSLMNVGIVYSQFGANQKALDYFLKSLEIKQQLNNAREIAQSYLNLGVLYSNLENGEKSLEYFNKSLTISNDNNLIPNRAQSLNNIGNYYARQSNFDSALYFHKAALRSRLTYNNKRLIAESYNNVGNLFYDLTNFDSARFYLTRSLDFRYKIKDKNGIANSLISLSKLNLKTGLKQGVEDSLKKVLEITEMNGNIIERKSAFDLLSQYYGSNDQPEKAYQALIEFHILKDSLTNKSSERKIYQQEKQFALLQSEKELEKNKIEISNQKFLIVTFVVIILLTMVLIAIGIYLFKIKSKSLIEIQDKNQKIETLMRELHHRVKNNLQVISSLLGLQSMKLEDPNAKVAVEEGKNRVKAMSMIHQRLYQNKDVSQIDFDQYVNDLVQDLKLSYMPEGNIQINVDIPKTNFDVDTTLPLGLILNELVSNSFKYAFENIKEPILKVELLNEGDKRILTISDNGSGIDQNIDIKESNSFGLKLVNILVKQLKGNINHNSYNGMSYKIEFTC